MLEMEAATDTFPFSNIPSPGLSWNSQPHFSLCREFLLSLKFFFVFVFIWGTFTGLCTNLSFTFKCVFMYFSVFQHITYIS